METLQANTAISNGEITIIRAEIPQIEKDFIQNVQAFIRLREQILLKSQCNKSNYSKKISKFLNYETVKAKDKELKNLIKVCKQNLDSSDSGKSFSIDYYETSFGGFDDERTTNDTEMNVVKNESYPLIETVWNNVREHLDQLKENGEMSAYVIKYTNILKLHVENKIPLDHVCIIGLVSSKKFSSILSQLFEFYFYFI